jgi:hypothetical protein
MVDGETPVTEDELAQLCADRLGSYRKPGKVVMTTEPLPKSPVGKILRRALREHYAMATIGVLAATDSALGSHQYGLQRMGHHRAVAGWDLSDRLELGEPFAKGP